MAERVVGFPSGYFILADDVAKSDCLTQLHPKVQVDNQCVRDDYER